MLTIAFPSERGIHYESLNAAIPFSWGRANVQQPTLLLQIRTNTAGAFMAQKVGHVLCRSGKEKRGLIRKQPEKLEAMVILDSLDEN